jgi:hypothetical protein
MQAASSSFSVSPTGSRVQDDEGREWAPRFPASVDVSSALYTLTRNHAGVSNRRAQSSGPTYPPTRGTHERKGQRHQPLRRQGKLR